MPPRTLQVHGTVILEGSSLGIREIRRELDPHFHCHHYRANALLVRDVTEAELEEVHTLADAHTLTVAQVRDTRTVRIAEDAESEAVPQDKQPKLDLLQGNWYKTNQDAFPLMHVLLVRNEIDPYGQQLWLFDVDFVAPDQLPMQATIDAVKLKGLNPKPASVEDFEVLDLIPPADLDPDPHVIPSVDDEVEKVNADKTAGVSMLKAHLSSTALAQTLGDRLIRHEIAPASDGGYFIEAVVKEGTFRAPDEIAGTPVRYLR
jgi:hypothetical protein